MKPLPLPIRLAAGIAVSAKERAQDLPKQLSGLPVTVASQVLQLSMRVQQQVTELAIKGEAALSGLQPVEETPSWATFDEDVDEREELYPTGFDEPDVAVPPPRGQLNGRLPGASLRSSRFDTADEPEQEADPWSREADALAVREAETERDEAGEQVSPPSWLPDYDELSLPQVRARLRRFTREQLVELLAYERATANRPSFTGMLERRIDTVSKQAGEDGAGPTS
ncbi:lipid droplet-associated protein [Haloechinothrix salitolerans]|uniref:Lipid droplet-associated protein n=1 Tax=Haloechinothrix salitolerans TaxID=926830 RepID=A0ABW2BY65_9PSEU